MEANLALLVNFDEIKAPDYVKKKFSVVTLEVRSFLVLVTRMETPTAKNIHENMKKKSGTCNKPLVKTMFSRSPNPIVKEIWSDQVRQVIRVLLIVDTYSVKENFVLLIFQRYFREGHSSIMFLNDGQ